MGMFKFGGKGFVRVAGIAFVFLLMAILHFNPVFISSWINSLENWAYDVGVRANHRPLGKDDLITIVDIDDASLEAIGRWPWSRDVMAKLTARLYELGATVIAFDILFSESEENIVSKVIKAAPKDSDYLSKLEKLKESFDFDAAFAKSLKMGDSILAIAFNQEGKSVGTLPPPLLTLEGELAMYLDIPVVTGYLSNVATLVQAVKYGAFTNASPDEDGILRFSPLLLRYGNDVYPSLGLQAAALYLLTSKTTLKTGNYGGLPALEGVQLDHIFHSNRY